MQLEARLSALIVEGFRWACASERVVDRALAGLAIRRRYFGQKGQDRWVVERALPGLRDGYFVEVGAGDGRTHSNTYVLERDHSWRGLLIEPNPAYADDIRRLRTSQLIPYAADRVGGEGTFLALGYMGGLIGEDTDYAPARRGRILRRHGDKIMSVSTRRLDEILRAADAPSVIDYLSLDVEGAEARILGDFPFDRYSFRAITVERPTREIHARLAGAGYVLDRVRLCDGFYVSGELADRLAILNEGFSGMARKFF